MVVNKVAAVAVLPEGSDYRPDPKSRTAREIAWRIVCEEEMIIDHPRERRSGMGAVADA